MDTDDLIRFFDRQLKIRILQAFERDDASVQDMEREFALEALDLMQRQPAMADLAGGQAPPVRLSLGRSH